MIKIFLTVRNRLAITKKCIKAIQKHSTMPYQLYVYDNQTNHRLKEHFEYFADLYEKGLVSQVTFNTNASTFNAFSKAASNNMFLDAKGNIMMSFNSNGMFRGFIKQMKEPQVFIYKE